MNESAQMSMNLDRLAAAAVHGTAVATSNLRWMPFVAPWVFAHRSKVLVDQFDDA